MTDSRPYPRPPPARLTGARVIGTGSSADARRVLGAEPVTLRRRPTRARQVLHRLLPALAGAKPNVAVNVEHRDLSEAADELLTKLRALPADR